MSIRRKVRIAKRICLSIPFIGILALVSQPHTTYAQKSNRPKGIKKTEKVWARGLPEDAQVNPTMFFGVELTTAQGKKIAHIAKKFAAEDAKRQAKNPTHMPLDSVAKVKLIPILERQRLAYREILTPEQQLIYDKNTEGLMQRWLSSESSNSTR